MAAKFLLKFCLELTEQFLADRPNGRAYAIQCCVCRRRLSSVTLCIVAKWCVLEQKLLLTPYESYMRNRLVPN